MISSSLVVECSDEQSEESWWQNVSGIEYKNHLHSNKLNKLFVIMHEDKAKGYFPFVSLQYFRHDIASDVFFPAPI